MTHELDLLTTLCGALIAALLFGFATQRVGLSPLVGYLLAGIVVGPFTPGFVAHAQLAEQLAELGVILLLFGVGLHFHPEHLVAVRRTVLPGALVPVGVATALGTAVAVAFGWGLGAGVVFGLSLSVASTVVLARVLADHGEQHTPTGRLAVGWLVVEDLFTVIVLVLLPTFAGGVVGLGQVAGAAALALLKLATLVVLALVGGRRVIPAALTYVARTRSRELFTLAVLAIALGIAVAAARVFGVSMALGAFLAGMIVGQSPYAARAAAEALPMRDAFAVLFFVSVGMLLDPQALVRDAGLIGATLAVVLIGKPLAAVATVLLLRHPIRTAVVIGAALAQVGEFSFILVSLARQHGLVPAAASSAVVAVAIVSISLNPLLFAGAQRLGRRLAGAGRRLEPQPPAAEAPRAVVVGYGPVGRALTTILRHEGIAPVVIELNPDTVTRLSADGTAAVYGDAAQREVLERAGIAEAGSLIFTADEPLDPLAVVHARELSPELFVLARARYAADVPALERAGAQVVVAGEVEVAWAMAEQLLAALGATTDHLDRQRERVRAEVGRATVPR